MKTYTHNHTERLTDLRATKPLLHMLGLLYHLIGRCMPGGAAYDRYARQARQVRRTLDGFKRHNWRVTVKWGMLRTQSLRDKVLSDLGGEEALLKWELRAMAAHRKAFEPDGAADQRTAHKHSARSHKAVRTAPKVTTDRLGLFRLAPIVRPRADREPPFRGYDWEIKARMAAITPKPVDLDAVFAGCGRDEAGEFHYDYDPDIDSIKPIPLLPDELRGVDIEICPDLEARYQTILAEDIAKDTVQDTDIPKLEHHPQADFVVEMALNRQASEAVCPDEIITAKEPAKPP